MVLKWHKWDHISQPTHKLHMASSYITPWFFSTIANIVNRAPVSTYISQVIGNHPTSTELSMAKHIFNPRPIPVKGVISGQGMYMHQVVPFNSYNLMNQS